MSRNRDYKYLPVVVNNLVEAPSPDEQEGRRFTMELSANEMAALFAIKGWQVTGSRGPRSVPDADEILTLFVNLARTIEDKPEALYNTIGRLLTIKDSDFPGSVDLYVHVGTMDLPLRDTPDDELEEFIND